MTAPSSLTLQRRIETAAADTVESGATNVGVDVVEIAAFSRQLEVGGQRLRARWFTLAEATFCEDEHDRLAATLAGKEAVAKVLRTGLRGGVRWTQIEILRHPHGAPFVSLHAAARERARALAIDHIAVSLCHEGPFAVALACAVALGDSQ